MGGVTAGLEGLPVPVRVALIDEALRIADELPPKVRKRLTHGQTYGHPDCRGYW